MALTGVTSFGDLRPEALAEVLGDRAVRSFPALLATGPEASAWARAGGPHGAVVVSDYQASPRGRAGLEWVTTPGHGLGFSVLLHPTLPAEREGWLYLVVIAALADVLGPTSRLDWPDAVVDDTGRLAAVGLQSAADADTIAWAVATVLVDAAAPPRAVLLRDVLAAIEGRLSDPPDDVLGGARERCATFGRQVRARLIPMGPDGVEVVGEAVDLRADGSLVIADAQGRRIAVPPQVLGRLEPAEPEAVPGPGDDLV